MLSRRVLHLSKSSARNLFWKKDTPKCDCECEDKAEKKIPLKTKKKPKGESTPPPPSPPDIPDIPFQRPVRQEAPIVRLGFIPEEWFTMFYNKTGVTGPYMFGVGLLTYLFSKEIYVMEHEFYSGLSLLMTWIYVVKKIGPKLANYADKEVDKYEAEWKNEKAVLMDNLDKEMELERKSQYAAEGGVMMLNAKHENVNLQLETDYRKRLEQAHKTVKNRLDYLVARRNVEERIQHKHKVNWIVGQTISSITAEQKKEEIDKCFADLSAMATRMKDLK